jgi:peptide/nickel transport system permease protein
MAPLYARYVSRTDPFRSNPNGFVDGQAVLAENAGLGVTPIGPGWRGAYLLGADAVGRDVAARLLFGGRTSMLVAGSATGLLDLLWAFPVYLLAISLSIVLVNEGLRLGPVVVNADSLALPILILGLVYVPYVARPVRAEVIGLKRGALVEAAVATGGSRAHVLRRHVLPMVWPTVAGLAPIVAAMMLLTEAALSVLGIGVQPPAASWGTLIADGQTLIYSRPWVAIAPGLAVVVTVLCLNALSYGRDR